MRHLSVLFLTSLPAMAPLPLSAHDFDRALMGNWTLNVPKSSFGPDGAPTAGTVRWTEHGWVLAMVFPGGYVYADAVVTDHGCALIGVAADYTCSLEILAPTHVRFTLKQGATVRRVGDIELLDKSTTRTVHQVTPASGPRYTETTLWTRDAD
jgi:hypothetical protein